MGIKRIGRRWRERATVNEVTATRRRRRGKQQQQGQPKPPAGPLNGKASRLRPFILSKPDPQREIKTGIIKAVDRMHVLNVLGMCTSVNLPIGFPLVNSMFDSPADKTTPKSVRLALKSLREESEASSDAKRAQK